METLLKPLKLLWLWMEKETIESERQIIALAYIALICFPAFYFFWHHVTATAYENLPLRILASILSIPLIFKNYWPRQFKKFLPFYWFFTLTYLIPFFFTFMLLKNNGSTAWQINSVLALFLLLLLVDWLAAIFMLMIGFILGSLAFILSSHNPQVPALILPIIPDYIAMIGCGALFSQRRKRQQIEKIYREKLDAMKGVSSTIAHELRTPLAAINVGVLGIQRYFPDLIESYRKAKDADLTIPKIPKANVEKLAVISKKIESETRYANLFIDMLLVNINQSAIDEQLLEEQSIVACVNKALDRYPFQEGEKQLIEWDKKYDFTFRGIEILLIHVLFNLLKNALYYIKKSGKGKIAIWIEAGEKHNFLYFKDTGQGIAAKELPLIFNQFYSKTYHGTGLGLAFSKMVLKRFKGDITCNSEEGIFTQFTLLFPKINNKNRALKHRKL